MRRFLQMMVTLGGVFLYVLSFSASGSADATWQSVPMVSQDILDAGYTGGEGAQAGIALACDPVEGTLVLVGIDVGGRYRSTDGGEHFESSNLGNNARGCCAFAIDPNNIDRVLSIGANSGGRSANGIYLSTDRGATWDHKLSRNTAGARDMRNSVAFDPSSFDEEIGGSAVAYWSSGSATVPRDPTGRLFKSTDGGETWREIPDSTGIGESEIRIHPTKGYVYAGNERGFFRSVDGGATFTQIVSDVPVYGVDVVMSQPDTVFIAKPDGVYKSVDSGETFVPAGKNRRFPSPLSTTYKKMLTVSPADPDRMFVNENTGQFLGGNTGYYSHDGGDSWSRVVHDTETNNWLEYNSRPQRFACHPTDPDIVFSFGGAFVTKSTDGGKTFAWNNNGFAGNMVGGLWNFNVHDPDIIGLGSRDHNAALSIDGGTTWKYVNLAQQGWGGKLFGAYASSADVMFAGDSGTDAHGPRTLKVARDIQGEMTVTDTGLVYSWLDCAYGDPRDPDVVFASKYRSADGGLTWSEMDGCDGVVTHNPTDSKELYGGYDKNVVVVSTDSGVIWTTFATLPPGHQIEDLAYDHVRNRVYAATKFLGGRQYLLRCDGEDVTDITESLTPDQYGSRFVKTVAVDPRNTDVVYVGGAANQYITDTSVQRSTDAGVTWQVLTRNLRGNSVTTGPGEGWEGSCVRVHPETGELWVSTACFGTAKIAGPELQGAADQWTYMPMVNRTILDLGNPGGEGCQVLMAIECDPQDGSFIIAGTDVGGRYRSIDGGEVFEPSNVGNSARGCNAIAIDPNNTDRVLSIGANSASHQANGIYLSTDRGATWTQKLSRSIEGSRDPRNHALAFDPSSYDEEIGGSSIAYWSSGPSGAPRDPTGRLLKSTDGGETWHEIEDSTAYGNSGIRVHPTRGYLYVGNKNGFFRSTDGGASFEQTLSDGPVYGLDVVNTYPDCIYITKPDGVYVSTDCGETFSQSGANRGFPSPVSTDTAKQLKVSPADPSRMLVNENDGRYLAGNKCYYSHDGGDSWHRIAHDTSLSWIPTNMRFHDYAWHPTDPDVVWSFGGDYISKSTDGGKTFHWSNNGNSGIMAGGLWSFNVYDPDIVAFGSQDYNMGLTTDGGNTWEYVNFAQTGWGGEVYGAYAGSADVIVGGDAGTSNRNPRTLKVARDVQGQMTVTNTRLVYGWLDCAYGDPGDPDVLFASKYRSIDGGLTWSEMDGCDGVVTHNPTGSKELYGGYDKNVVVVSTDSGATWTAFATLPPGHQIKDLAYDHVRNRMYAATKFLGANHYLFRCDGPVVTDITSSVTPDQYGKRLVQTVAVDPNNTDIVYVGGPGNLYLSDASVQRSTDAGSTWHVLTRNLRGNSVTTGPGRGWEALCVRVHPVTSELWVSTGCFGFARLSPPPDARSD